MVQLPELEIVPHGSDAYRQTVSLRYHVLREPLGLSYTPEQLDSERDDIHLAARLDGRIVGCLILSRRGAGRLQMRQLAVAPETQRRGMGALLERESERIATAEGISEIFLHARQTAVEFYRKLGYNLYGEPFQEVGLPHRSMRKRLYPTGRPQRTRRSGQ